MESNYHTPKTCDLIPEPPRQAHNKDRHWLYSNFCETHGVGNICRCGWEFGKHPVNQQVLDL